MSNASQVVQCREDGAVLVGVHPERIDFCRVQAPVRYEGNDPEALAALQPGPHVESDDVRVQQLAVQAVGKARNVLHAVRTIAFFVYRYVTPSENVQFATAAEVARSPKGDCSEYAVLYVALCRAAGIPARIISGVLYCTDTGAFELHYWAEVLVGEKWFSIDPTRPDGFGNRHIALERGAYSFRGMLILGSCRVVECRPLDDIDRGH